MKPYWSIPGFREGPETACIAFRKYDGSNIRAEWSRKTGWYKFGSRTVLIDKHSPLADAVDIFKNTYGESIAKVFTDNPKFKKIESALCFVEYFGANSFAGQHDPQDPKQVVLIDVNIHKKGFVLPEEFIGVFGHLKIAEVIYRGVFDKAFIAGIQQRTDLGEGVVAKGILPTAKNPQHSLWMAKVKTFNWLDSLKKRAETDASLQSILADNLKEQCL